MRRWGKQERILRYAYIDRDAVLNDLAVPSLVSLLQKGLEKTCPAYSLGMRPFMIPLTD